MNGYSVDRTRAKTAPSIDKQIIKHVKMAANVSESPGQPPGDGINKGQSASNTMPVQACRKSIAENGIVQEKPNKEKRLTPILCSPSKTKRRLDSSDGHDDSTCDPQLESLCRKKFKPIAPKPTVKKDQHQSVVTATVPIKDVSQPNFGSSFCMTKTDGKNGAMMFVSPKVQLIPSVPIIAHAPPLNGETLVSNSSPFSVTVPLLPHGKYLNIMNPPARVAMTDVAGHYKTVVQLLPNSSSHHGYLQPSNYLSANGSLSKPGDDISSSKTVPARNEHSRGRNGMSASKTSKTKTVSKPRAGRYKYSLLMNGGSYDVNAATNQKLPTSIPPAVSLNEGVRLNLPAVLTSSGVLQITVPSVGIANGKVQFCDVPPPADVVHTQSSVVQTTTAQAVYTSGITSTSTVQPVCTVSVSTAATASGLTLSNGSEPHTNPRSVSQTTAEKTSAPNTNALSLDETLRVMLRSPRTAIPQNACNKQTEPCQTKKKKPRRTSASAGKSRNKAPKAQINTSLAPSVSESSNSREKSIGRIGIANSLVSQSVEEISPNPVDGVHRALLSGCVSEQRNIDVTAVGQNVQYRPADVGENRTSEQITLGQEVTMNHRSLGTIPTCYVVNGATVNQAHSATSKAQTSADIPDPSSRVTDASVSAVPHTRVPLTNGLASMPSQTVGQNHCYGRQSVLSTSMTISNDLQSSVRTVNDQWTRTDIIAPRASSLPNFATGPRGFFTGTTTAPLINFNSPQTANHLAQQRPRDSAPVPSPINFDQGAATSTLPASSIVPFMQSQQTMNIATFASHSKSVTSVSGFNSRTESSSSTSSSAIGRNTHSHLQRNLSSHRSHDALQPISSVHSVQIPSETIGPQGNAPSASYQIAGHQSPNAHSHNTVASVHSTNQGFPSISSGPSNSSIPTTLPTPPVPHGTYLPDVNRPRIAPVPGSSIREERGDVVPARRRLQLPDENPGGMHPEINGGLGSVGHSRPNSDLPAVIASQTNQEPVVQRQSVDASVARPNGLQVASLPDMRPEESLFTPPLSVVPHHAGILATAILRSRALERNPWGVPALNASTPPTVPNGALPTPTTVIPNTSAGYFGVTQAASVTTGIMSHTHPADHMLHLRPTTGTPSSLGGSTDKELPNWPGTPGGTLIRYEGENLAGAHAAQLTLERQGRMVAPPLSFPCVVSAEQAVTNPVTTASGEQVQNVQGHVQSVPLHSNIPANARNAMNGALQRRTRNPRIHPPRSETPNLVVSTQSHAASVVVSTNQESSSLTGTQSAHLIAERQEMTATDSQHATRGQSRLDLLPHQHTAHHMHATTGTRVPSDSVSHLPMPLMPPPSVLYGSSTPVPNLSMTPLHGVPLPGSLSAHSMQGHGVTHQLHATPPPAPHHGQSTGPNPQGSVNHMFVPTPYGPIHRSLYMPPPSPHPPDLSLMSPRSYGQVHMHDSVLYSPRFSSPIRNLSGSSLAEGMFSSTLPRSFSDDRLDTCCSGPYAHSPPIHDNSSHLFPAGFMSPSMSRNQPPLQTSLCNSLQRPFNHRGHQGMPERLPGSFYHDSLRQPAPNQVHIPVTQTSSFTSTLSSTGVTNVCSSLDTSVLVSAASSGNPTQQAGVGSSLTANAQSPASSSTSAMASGSTSSSSVGESSTTLPPTATSSSSATPVRLLNLGSTSDKYLPLELVVSSPSTVVTTSASVTALPAQLSSEQIVKFGDVLLECSRQILRESGRTVLCCWSCDYHTAEPKKMYRHQRRDEQPMKCQLCSHMGVSRCQLNQHFKEVHMDKDEDPFRTSAVT